MAGFRTFLRDPRGAAAAEMALLLPLLVTLLFVAFEGGYFLWNQHKVVKGVRDGARYAGRLAFSKYDCTTNSIPDSAVETNIKNVTRTGYPNADNPNVTGTDNPTIFGWINGVPAGDSKPGVTVTVSCQTGKGGLYDINSGNAPRVTVAASAPYPDTPVTTLAEALGFDVGDIHLNASAQSAVMGL